MMKEEAVLGKPRSQGRVGILDKDNRIEEGLCSETGEPVWKRVWKELVLGDEAGEVTRTQSSVDLELQSGS